jgi:phosphoribosylformylglycinamidine synthase
MFNDFKGYDENGEPIKISAPPTLLTSSIGVIPDVIESISLVPKAVGDLVYVLGETRDECGASEYYDMLGYTGNNVPDVDGDKAKLLYKCYTKAARKRVISSAIPVGFGGLGAALAKMAIAGQMGMDIELDALTDIRMDKLLFSESAGRIVVTVAPQNVKAFEKLFDRVKFTKIGHIAYTQKLNINNVISTDIKVLDEHYKAPLRNY